jgi:predicted negative regulator of RcsB-dependent stress response
MPRVVKKRVQKKESAEVDVQERLDDIREKFRERQKSAVTYGIVAVVLILLVGFVFVYRNSTAEKARKLEYDAYKIYYNEYQKVPLSNEERYQKALDLFKQAYAASKNPRMLLYAAASQAALNKNDEALASLNDLVKAFDKDKDVLPLAFMTMADIQLKKGNKAEALKALDGISKAESPIYKDYALITAGRILEGDGKKDEAAAKFRELAEKYKDSPFADEAKARLGGEKKAD